MRRWGVPTSQTSGPEVFMPSFQPAKGASRAHSTIDGRTMVIATAPPASASRLASRCSERPFVYV